MIAYFSKPLTIFVNLDFFLLAVFFLIIPKFVALSMFLSVVLNALTHSSFLPSKTSLL